MRLMTKFKRKSKIPTPAARHYWSPQEGPQTEAITCPVDEIFYGGTRGGGKSDALIGRQLRGAMKHGNKWNGLIIRRKYEDFGEIRRRFDELIDSGLPAIRIGGENQTNYIRFDPRAVGYAGAQIRLTAVLHPDKLGSFTGHQYTEISIDEAPDIPFIAQAIDMFKGCLRSPHGIHSQMFLTGNPGGAGSASIKAMYIPFVDGGQSPVAEGAVNHLPDGTGRVFIRSTLADNHILVENDPRYVNRLMSIKNDALRKAWLEGRWDVFIGQAFNFTERNVISPIWPIPDHVPIYMTYDWGYGAPFSIGWWWIDQDNRVYRFAEWYGWKGADYPNVGLRITDEKVAEGIIEREKKMEIDGRSIVRLCDPTSFNKKPDYKGGGQGPSTAEEFETAGGKHTYDLRLLPGDPNRTLKIRAFRNRLEASENPDELPMLVVYDTCQQFIRTIPSLCVDELTGEDLENGQEDHVYDESCHVVMGRPMGADLETILRDEQTRKRDADLKKLDRASQSATKEVQRLKDRLRERNEEWVEGDEMEGYNPEVDGVRI